MPESLKNHDTWGAQVCRVGTRKCTTYQVLSIFTGESGIWCQKPESVVRPKVLTAADLALETVTIGSSVMNLP